MIVLQRHVPENHFDPLRPQDVIGIFKETKASHSTRRPCEENSFFKRAASPSIVEASTNQDNLVADEAALISEREDSTDTGVLQRKKFLRIRGAHGLDPDFGVVLSD